jgi:hypothetical protein
MMKRSHLKLVLFGFLSVSTAGLMQAGPKKMSPGGLTLMAEAAARPTAQYLKPTAAKTLA